MVEIKIKCRVRASVNPTPHTNAERIWLSSGRVPLYEKYKEAEYIKLSIMVTQGCTPKNIQEIFLLRAK